MLTSSVISVLFVTTKNCDAVTNNPKDRIWRMNFYTLSPSVDLYSNIRRFEFQIILLLFLWFALLFVICVILLLFCFPLILLRIFLVMLWKIMASLLFLLLYFYFFFKFMPEGTVSFSLDSLTMNLFYRWPRDSLAVRLSGLYHYNLIYTRHHIVSVLNIRKPWSRS